jgi:hypothetical protein
LLLQVTLAEEDYGPINQLFERKWNFLICTGALDDKHITIQAPTKSGHYYCNYTDYPNNVLMESVNAQYKFIVVNTGCNVRTSHGGVFSAPGIPHSLEHHL